MRTLIKLNDNMVIGFCSKASEICLYDNKDNLCYHWDNQEESIKIIKDYCKYNNQDTKEIDYLLTN